MMEFDDGEAPAEDMVQCNTCERSFFPKVLERHVIICKKGAAKKRKVFDSSRQRAEGTDIPTLKPIKPKAETPKKPKADWRRKHEDLIAALRHARTVTQVLKDGGPLPPPPPPPTYDPDYVQCPYCQRRFNENAADRHIKFCREQAARMPNKNKLDVKKNPARTQFKPSAPAKKVNPPALSPSPSAPTHLPQRSTFGQSTPNPSSKMSPAGTVRGSPSGLTSPPSGAISKNRAVRSGFGPRGRTQPGIALNKNDVDGVKEAAGGGMKGKVCHDCGTKYPVESAKFCCECGIRRMRI